jgi:hypothetical protein
MEAVPNLLGQNHCAGRRMDRITLLKLLKVETWTAAQYAVSLRLSSMGYPYGVFNASVAKASWHCSEMHATDR